MQIDYYEYFQLFSLISCIIFYKDVRKYKIGAFLPLCILVCMVELLGSNTKFFGWASNHFLENIYLMFSTPLYFYIFYKTLDLSKKIRALYIIIALVYTLFSLYNYFFFQGTAYLNTLTVTIQQLITILLSCALLFQLATNEKYFVLSKEPYFWIAAGLLIFSLGTLVVIGMYQYIRINNLTIKNRSLYNVIMPVLNIVLYSAYTYAFYLCKPKKKSYSPS